VSSRYFHLERVADGIYAAVVKPGTGAWGNAGIVDLGDKTVVFDTFATPQAARDLKVMAEQLTGRAVEVVVNSHRHIDHVGGKSGIRRCRNHCNSYYPRSNRHADAGISPVRS